MQLVVAPKALRYREAAYQSIKEAILSGKFAPGEPLIEEQIALALNISRTPVREALAILEHEQLIAPRQGRGLFVRQITPEAFIDMFVANEAVEPYLARQAALLATGEQLEQMQAAIEEGIAAASSGDISGGLRSGRNFHRLVGEAAGNQSLTQFAARNEERTDLYLLSYGKKVSNSAMSASNNEHQAILGAIGQRECHRVSRIGINRGEGSHHHASRAILLHAAATQRQTRRRMISRRGRRRRRRWWWRITARQFIRPNIKAIPTRPRLPFEINARCRLRSARIDRRARRGEVKIERRWIHKQLTRRGNQ